MSHSFNNIKIYQINENDFPIINNSKILILVLENQYNTSEEELLNKILKAVNLNSENSNLIKVNDEDVSISHLIRSAGINTFIIFGKTANQIGFNFNYAPYQWVNLEDSKLLFCDGLPQINADKNLKMSLWNALKLL